MVKRVTSEEYFERLFNKFPEYKERYSYPDHAFTGIMLPLEHTCNVCGYVITKQRASDHLKGDGCPQCSGRLQHNKAILIQRSVEKFGNKFDFSVTEDFVGMHTKISIGCPRHGIVETTSRLHLKSVTGCPKCYRYDREEILEAFYANGLNDLLTLPYLDHELQGKSVKRYITVRCAKHGDTKKELSKILKGIRCNKCVHESLNKDVSLFKEQFENIYTNLGVTVNFDSYINSSSSIVATCKQHGSWLTTPNRLVNGKKVKGCPVCNVSKVSPQSLVIAEKHKDRFLKETSGVYLIKLKNELIDCYKLGIAKDYRDRANSIKRETGIEPELIYYNDNIDKYNAILIEQTLLQNRAEKIYHSPVKFSGSSELLTLTDDDSSNLVELLDTLIKGIDPR